MGVGTLEAALLCGMVDKNNWGTQVSFAQGLISFTSSPALEIFIYIFFYPQIPEVLPPKCW
jgi:hypothetical protein